MKDLPNRFRGASVSLATALTLIELLSSKVSGAIVSAMLQGSVKFASALLAVGWLVMPSVVLAGTPLSITEAQPSNHKDQSQQPELPGQQAVSAVAQPKPDAFSRLTIPASLAPYLDPGFHPDRPFEPNTLPGSTATQALRLEIHLSQRKVMLYRGDTPIKSYAIAVGRPGWETPVGTYAVQQMIKNPTWIHPLEKGVVIPGGDPENPLGHYWIGFWTDGKNWIGFHGTPTPRSVGRAASHGCIRMYNQDVEELFKQVTIGTVVTVVK